MKLLRTILAGSVSAVLSCAPASAQFFGTGWVDGSSNFPTPDLSSCDFKVPTTFAHVWYFDPVNGDTLSNGADGSQAHPWKDIQAIFQNVTGYTRPLLSTAQGASVTLSPINPGDEILLNSGTAAQYGRLLTSPSINSSYVVITAAPGQTPVLSSIGIGGTSRLALIGFAVQQMGTTQQLILDGSAAGNIVIDHMSLSSADYSTASTWTQAQWISNAPASAIGVQGVATCLSVTNTHIFDVSNAVTFGNANVDNRIYFANNEIDHFGQDAIDFGGADIVIRFNHLHDPINLGNLAHQDFMQGFSTGTFPNNHDIWIDSNLEIFKEDPALPFIGTIDAIGTPTGGSGGTDGAYTNVSLTGGLGSGATANITIAGGAVTVVTIVNKGLGYKFNDVLSATVGGVTGFNVSVTAAGTLNGGITDSDEHWSHFIITNNSLAVSPFPTGISVGGCNDCLVAQNTVLDTAIKTSIADVTGRSQVRNNSNIFIINNLCAVLASADPNAQVINNVVAHGQNSNIFTFNGSSTASVGAAGTYIGGNIIDTGGILTEVTSYDPVGLVYNFHLLSSAAARGFGTANLPRPLVDSAGRAVNNPPDVGSVAYP